MADRESEAVVARRPVRAMVWFWGTGGAGIRLADRFARILAETLGAAQVSVSYHADNPLRTNARMRGHSVSVVGGAAGHARKLALAAQATPRFLDLWRHVRTQKPDIVFVPMNFALAWPFCMLFRLRQTKVITMVHDAVPHPGDFAPRWQAFTQRALIASSQSLLAPSAYTAGEIRRACNTDPEIHLVPLASLVEARRAEPRGVPQSPVRFLFLGRLITYKGLDLLAEAVRTLASRTDWSLTIAGDGPDRSKVRDLFGGLPQVDLSLLRHIDEAEIESLISSHDVLLCPYREASQSGVIAEAQADGMPCVVTPVGALPEQIGGGSSGRIAAQVSPDAIGNAMLEVLEDRTSYPDKSSQALQACAKGTAVRAFEVIVASALGRPSGAGR